jgi:hypothetical protein
MTAPQSWIHLLGGLYGLLVMCFEIFQASLYLREREKADRAVSTHP